MVQNFQSVETNAITAADTRVQLTSYMGSDQSPLLVPGGSRVLAAILVAWTNDGAAGANNTAAWIRLSGAGLIEGEKSIAIAAQGNAVATGNFFNMVSTIIPLNLPVRQDNIMIVEVEQNVDGGTGACGVTLVYE